MPSISSLLHIYKHSDLLVYQYLTTDQPNIIFIVEVIPKVQTTITLAS